MSKAKTINVKDLFYSKNPKLAKLIPEFIYKLISKLLCLKDVNEFIIKYGDRQGTDYADAIMEYLNTECVVEGIENLPEASGRYIFASNHPFGGPDGIALIHVLAKKYSKLKFPVNDILMNLKNLDSIFLPVNKHGSLGREAAIGLEKAYQSDAQIIMFPAGIVSRKNKGVVKDLQWQKNFIVKAIQYQRDIIPIHIDGVNSDLFYNINIWRKRFGIKINFEMLLLPRETFKKRNTKIHIKIGKPIPYSVLRGGKEAIKNAEEIREIVYKL